MQTESSLNQIKCDSYELIFVNDGSPDNSLEVLLEKKQKNDKIAIIDLSRNFGHHYALQTGLMHSKGEYVFLIDNDLEVSPKVLVDFYKELTEAKDLDVVYGCQASRKGGFVERVSGHLFWSLLNKMSDFEIPKNLLTERLMSRRYVDKLLSLQDANLFLGGMFHWVGFKQKGMVVHKTQRTTESTYTLWKRMQLMTQAITSFSGKPLMWLFNFGLLTSFFSICFIIYLVINKLAYGEMVQYGWTSIVAINVLVLGVFSTFLGIVGIYLFKIFNQVQGRPNSIVKKIY